MIDWAIQGLFTALFAGLGSYILWRLVGPRIVVQAIQERMGPALHAWLTTPVPTGKMTKMSTNDGDVDVAEVKSPLDLIMISAGDSVYRRLMGRMGGDARKRGAVQDDIREGMLADGSPFGGLLNQINPRLLERAIKDGDYIPIILEQLGPVVKQYLDKRLSSGESFR